MSDPYNATSHYELGRGRLAVLCWLVAATLAGCAGGGTTAVTSSPDTTTPARQNEVPKRIVIAMVGDPPGLSTHINPAGTASPGLPELVDIISPGLSVVNSDGARVPFLAESIPST